MDKLFMRAFESWDSADAQMRQQAASYSRTLVSSLLAAGHPPPPWLLPHPAPFAALFRWCAAAEEEMRQQVEAYSQSIACALLNAGHLPPPWLLSHSAAAGTSKRSVPADARMRKQVVSYSLSIACALLAAGHRPPPWILQSPADVASEVKTVRKAPHYLVDPQSANHVEHILSEINHHVKQDTLEPVSSLEVPQCETFEGPNSVANTLLENDLSDSAKPDFLEVHDFVSCPLPEIDAIDTVENVSIKVPQVWGQTDFCEGTYPMPSVLLDNDKSHCVQTDFPEETDFVPSVLIDKEASQSSETKPFCLVSPKIEKVLLHTTQQNDKLRKRKSLLLDKCDNKSSIILEQQSLINESALQLYHLADTTEAHDVCVWNNTDIAARPEALSAVSSKREERNSIMLSGKNADHVQHVLSEINHVKQDTLEPVSSIEVPQCETFQGPSSIANPLLENDSPDSVEPDFLEGNDFVFRPLLEIDAIDTVENVSTEVSQVWGQTDSREGTYSMPSVLLNNDKSHCVQTDFPEETSFVPSLTDKQASQSSETRPSCLVSPRIEKDLLQTIQQNDKLRKRKSLLLDRCDNESSKILDQQSSINESALQLYHLADTTEAHDVSVWNNIDIDGRPEALGASSSKRASVSHTLERNSVMSFDKSVPMLECQSFSIPVPSDSLTITERALQGFCDSKKLVNFCSSLSVKYKIKPLDNVYQSLPSRFENLMNRSLSYSTDTNLLDPSYASKYSLDFDDTLMMSNEKTSSSSNVYSIQEDSDVPLTLSFEKYDLEKLSAMTGSSSDYLGSISGFGCSKIDEYSTILGGNENQAKPSHSIGRNCSRQCFGGRKQLGYATNIYQSKGTSSLRLTAGKSYIRKPDQHVHIKVNRDIKNPKGVHALSIMNARKNTCLLRDRLSKTEMSCSKIERDRSEPNLEKGCRPTISNLTSFIQLAKQNQQPPISCAKRDVTVRALKVAAAAKRREEKKQAEREMHKAAVKLALERSKQEKEHRQKQVEHRKKMGADFITRKRQKEGDGERENGRKKKGAEEASKHRKHLEEIIHSPNTMKDACPKYTDGKDLVENLIESVGNQRLSDEMMESVQRLLASESKSVKAIYVDYKSAGSGLQVQENLLDNVDKSYGMTPYENSDSKDFEILEHQREIKRRRKLIPSWAHEENLDKILVYNLALDPREIFARGCSANLSDVLTPGIPHQPFN